MWLLISIIILSTILTLLIFKDQIINSIINLFGKLFLNPKSIDKLMQNQVIQQFFKSKEITKLIQHILGVIKPHSVANIENGYLKIDYEYDGVVYTTLVLKLESTQPWTKVEKIESDVISDVTELAIKYAGPDKNQRIPVYFLTKIGRVRVTWADRTKVFKQGETITWS